MSKPSLTRRQALQLGAGSLALAASHGILAADGGTQADLVIGQPDGAAVGLDVLAAGGNAVDAVVAAALVAAVVSISNCGIGGYGGHCVIATADGKVSAIDFNSTAPAAARPDMFSVNAQGRVASGINSHGWLAAGVPGTLAGLQLSLEKFGTRRLDQVIEPAIRFARNGFLVPAGLGKAIAGAAKQFASDPGSAKLFLPDGKPVPAGARFRNPDLAAMLEQLALDNSVASFYRGPLAEQIAAQFAMHGGLVTARDLAAYEARVVEPLAITWRGAMLHTAPLTAGGLSVLQVIATLKALGWETWDEHEPRTEHARIEAMRLAWHDRLLLLGDPATSEVPVKRLLWEEYAAESAARVRRVVDEKQMIPPVERSREQSGTIHLSAVDKTGMMVALTLTHGEAFGAQVTVDGLGLILGHGMSRFEPQPGHPNSIHAGSRPLNNMCPTVITQDGKPSIAIGATGGRRIPNTMVDVLARLVGRGQPLAQAFKTPRLHTEGGASVQLGQGWPEGQVEYLKQVGYKIEPGAGANLNAIARDAMGGLAKVP